LASTIVIISSVFMLSTFPTLSKILSQTSLVGCLVGKY